MNVLVTGGAGYIGSHTVRELLARGHQVVVLDLEAIDPRGPLAGARGVVGDVADTSLVTGLLREEEIEGVIHFAGRKFVAESMRDPGRYFRVNVAGSLSVLEAMVASGTPLIVFSSSCTVYGDPDHNPTTEDLPLRPQNPYGMSKVMVEQMLEWYWRVHGISSLSLRYFNAAGASFDAALGERFDRTMMLIPMLMQATLGLREPVDIYGTDYPTPDGTAVRDYIHVVDLVDAHIRALEVVAGTRGARTLNLGTGRGSSVKEVIALVEAVTGREVPHCWADRRPGDAAAVWADPTRARDVLGWEARHDLQAMVETAWRWHSSHVGGHGASGRQVPATS
jgi:UDP-glucose 4-epimerase